MAWRARPRRFIVREQSRCSGEGSGKLTASGDGYAGSGEGRGPHPQRNQLMLSWIIMKEADFISEDDVQTFEG